MGQWGVCAYLDLIEGDCNLFTLKWLDFGVRFLVPLFRGIAGVTFIWTCAELRSWAVIRGGSWSREWVILQKGGTTHFSCQSVGYGSHGPAFAYLVACFCCVLLFIKNPQLWPWVGGHGTLWSGGAGDTPAGYRIRSGWMGDGTSGRWPLGPRHFAGVLFGKQTATQMTNMQIEHRGGGVARYSGFQTIQLCLVIYFMEYCPKKNGTPPGLETAHHHKKCDCKYQSPQSMLIDAHSPHMLEPERRSGFLGRSTNLMMIQILQFVGKKYVQNDHAWDWKDAQLEMWSEDL